MPNYLIFYYLMHRGFLINKQKKKKNYSRIYLITFKSVNLQNESNLSVF